jgi:hypothetical protein
VGSSSPFTKGSPLYTTSVRVWWVGVGGGWVEYDRSDWLGTLLGPERTSRCGLFFLAVLITDRLTLTWVCGVGGGGWCGGVWLFVECCIVDASILLW